MYTTQPPKGSLPESSAVREAPAPQESLAQEREQSAALLSTRYSVNAQTGSAQVSASLPRTYQKTDTSRLTSVVTPRPFGVHSRGISSLPRSFTVKFRFIPEVCKRGVFDSWGNSCFNVLVLFKKCLLCDEGCGNGWSSQFCHGFRCLLVFLCLNALLELKLVTTFGKTFFLCL